jgi:hypothetical protein
MHTSMHARMHASMHARTHTRMKVKCVGTLVRHSPSRFRLRMHAETASCNHENSLSSVTVVLVSAYSR